MLNRLGSYIKNNETKIILSNKSIDITNYLEIIIFEDTKILIKCFNYYLEINGNRLVINRLYDRELLINGEISSVKFKEGIFNDKLL